MSLGTYTKNDLCGNHTKLDYQALLRVAAIAFGHSIEQIHQEYSILRQYPPCSNVELFSHAEYLHKEAGKLAVIAETLATLQEGLDREELEIVNKPEVKGE